MNGDITSVQVDQVVVTDRTVKQFEGPRFVPAKIRHSAYIHKGDFWRVSTLFAEDGHNLTLYSADERADWPAPPSWFEEAAERLRLEAEELAPIRQERAS